MHEISLVQGLVDQLKTLAAENSASRVLRVTMEIGPLAGVVIDAFRFGFDVLCQEDPLLEEAELVIEVPDVRYTCLTCHHQQVTAGPRPDKCTACGDVFLSADSGTDLLLRQVEME
ncbi:MAG: hydrogenase maturation nickel metallochaperone HypA [Desulfopila sp.]